MRLGISSPAAAAPAQEVFTFDLFLFVDIIRERK